MQFIDSKVLSIFEKVASGADRHNFYFMLKADWKALVLMLFIAFFYTKCATLEYLTDRPDTSGTSTSTRTTSSKSNSAEAEHRAEVVAFAEKYVGAKYKYAGSDPKGFDCSGFTSYVMKNFDITLDRTSSAQSNNGAVVSVKDVQPGDLLFFSRSGGKVFHVGLVYKNSAEGLFMIHSTNTRGVVIDNISVNSYWKPKLYKARNVLTSGI